MKRLVTLLAFACCLAAAALHYLGRSDVMDTPQVMPVRSTAFENGSPIPVKYTGDAEDRSPALQWDGLPSGTKELALICDDPDAPRATPWVHWVLYNIPAGTSALGEGEKSRGVEGKNSWGTSGYRGPKPPPGKAHRYFFKLYALDTELRLTPGVEKEQLEKEMKGHVIGYGELMGTYQRR